jgi:ELL-associated factor
MTDRYDFKPASINGSEAATLEVGQHDEVTISIPHSDGERFNEYKGGRKASTKDCVLIIDHVTGKITLERLTHKMMVKNTR